MERQLALQAGYSPYVTEPVPPFSVTQVCVTLHAVSSRMSA
jgi:hypothetical protein